MSDKRKRAARAIMQENPGMSYTAALREADRRHRDQETLGIKPGAMGQAWRELVDEVWPWRTDER